MTDNRVVLFDLDGTLTDPRRGITKGVQHALAKFGVDEPSLEKLEPFIGPPLRQSFMDKYGFTALQAEQAVAAYREYFDPIGWRENTVFNGIPECLTRLEEAGYKIGLATSKPTVFAERIIKHFEMMDYFTVLIGSNLDGTREDKAEVIEEALAPFPEVDKSRIVMVGDRKYDILGAQKHGLRTIGVTYGFGTRAELEDAAADLIVDTPAQIMGAVEQLIGK